MTVLGFHHTGDAEHGTQQHAYVEDDRLSDSLHDLLVHGQLNQARI
jgi:hypothetical protein